MNGSQARAGNSVQDQARRCGAGSHGHSSIVGTNPAESCRSYDNCRSPCTWCYLNSVRATQLSYLKEYLGAVREHGRNCSSVPRASAMQPPRAALAPMPCESAAARRFLMGLLPVGWSHVSLLGSGHRNGRDPSPSWQTALLCHGSACSCITEPCSMPWAAGRALCLVLFS